MRLKTNEKTNKMAADEARKEVARLKDKAQRAAEDSATSESDDREKEKLSQSLWSLSKALLGGARQQTAHTAQG